MGKKMKIIDVAIVSSETASGLTFQLKEFVAEGWQPQGGVSCSYAAGASGNIYSTYCQTMVLLEVKNDYS